MRTVLILSLLVTETWIVLIMADHWGAKPVMLWLLGAAVLGVWWIRRQGLRIIAELRTASFNGELPALPLLDAALAFAVGVLLIVPGLISDVLALLLLASGLRRRLAQGVQTTMARRNPALRQPQQPVTLDGEFRER